MSDERFRASCDGKQALPSKAAALTVIRRRLTRVKRPHSKKANHHTGLARLDAYQCRYCHQWHVGVRG